MHNLIYPWGAISKVKAVLFLSQVNVSGSVHFLTMRIGKVGVLPHHVTIWLQLVVAYLGAIHSVASIAAWDALLKQRWSITNHSMIFKTC